MNNQNDKKEALLKHMSTKASNNSFYLGSAIKAYQLANQLDQAALAKWLGIDDIRLTLLELCSMPDTLEPKHSKDVNTIAEKFGIEPGKLEALLNLD